MQTMAKGLGWVPLLVVLVGCGGDGEQADGGLDGAAADAVVDGPSGSDGGDGGREAGPLGRPCSSDEDCDDGIDCTAESCQMGRCQVVADHAACNDGVYCNGVEQCHPRRGCVAGEPVACDDFDPCTIDACDEETKSCQHAPRDFDEDGEVDFRCMGGTDCDDFDPARGARIAERCGNGVDDDCDGDVDEADCGRPPHDDCADPLDVSAGGRFVLDTAGAAPDHDLSCAPRGSQRDVVLRLSLDAPRDVDVVAEGESLVWLAMGTTCGDPATELECHLGFPGRLRARNVPAGEYFLVVKDASDGGELVVDVTLSAPTPDPANADCSDPLDVSAGGRFEGTLVDVSDSTTLACGSGGPDAVHRFTLTEPRDVVVALNSTSGTDSMAFELRSSCDDEGSALRCTRGEPALARYHQLPAGTYYLWVEGASGLEVDYRLEIAFEAPTPPPPGDVCDDPIVLTPGEPYVGTLLDKQDDLPTRCGFDYRDAVHRFTLTEPSDVLLTADGGGSFVSLSVRSACASEPSELRCDSGSPATTRLRALPAGDYYVVVESYRASGYSLQLDVSPPTPVTDVSGNDTCASAFVVPSGGGFFRGDTSGLADDYGGSCGGSATSPDVAFQVELAERKRLVARTDGSGFDTVLTLHRGACGEATERECDDDGGEGTASMIDRVLEPGTWFVVVDGFGSGSSGEYLLEVTLADP